MFLDDGDACTSMQQCPVSVDSIEEDEAKAIASSLFISPAKSIMSIQQTSTMQGSVDDLSLPVIVSEGKKEKAEKDVDSCSGKVDHAQDGVNICENKL